MRLNALISFELEAQLLEDVLPDDSHIRATSGRNTYEALEHFDTLEMDLDSANLGNKDSVTHKLLRAVEEFHTYIINNQVFITNYGERYRQGDRISSGFVESAVNYVVAKRFTKRQQMQ